MLFVQISVAIGRSGALRKIDHDRKNRLRRRQHRPARQELQEFTLLCLATLFVLKPHWPSEKPLKLSRKLRLVRRTLKLSNEHGTRNAQFYETDANEAFLVGNGPIPVVLVAAFSLVLSRLVPSPAWLPTGYLSKQHDKDNRDPWLASSASPLFFRGSPCKEQAYGRRADRFLALASSHLRVPDRFRPASSTRNG